MRRNIYFGDYLVPQGDGTAGRQREHVRLQQRRATYSTLFIGILVFIGLAAPPAFSQNDHFALVVTGASGSEEFQQKFSKWSTQLIDILQKDLLH